jgi:hypothetical protein
VQRRGDRVEDRLVERVALRRVGDRQPEDAVARLVDEKLACDAPQSARMAASGSAAQLRSWSP